MAFSIASTGVGWAGFAGSAAFGLTAAAFLKNEERGYFRTAAITVPVSFAGFLAIQSLWDSSDAISTGVAAASSILLSKEPALFKIRDIAESGAASGNKFASAATDSIGPLSMEFYSGSQLGSKVKEAPLETVRASLEGLLDQLDEMQASALAPDQKRAWQQLADIAVVRARSSAFPQEVFAKEPNAATVDAVSSLVEEKGFRNLVQADLAALENSPDALRRYMSQLQSGLRPFISGELEPAPVYRASRELKFSYASGGRPVMDILSAKKIRLNEAELSELAKQLPHLEDPLRAAAYSKAYDTAFLYSTDAGKPVGIEFFRGGSKIQVPFVDPETGMVRTGEKFANAGAARKILHGESITPLDVYMLERLSEDWDALSRTAQRSIVWRASHVDDEFMQALTGVSSSGQTPYSELTPETAWFRQHQIVPTELPEFGGRTLEQMPLEERAELLKNLGSKVRKYGSESSIRNLVLEDPEIEKIRIGQLFSMKKQDPAFRSFSKPFKFRPESVPEYYQPRVLSSQLLEMFHGNVPASRLTFSGVSPHLVAFFGDLPSSVSGFSDEKLRNTLLSRLAEDIRASADGIPEEEVLQRARKALESVEAYFQAKPEALPEARALGTLGETEFLAAHRVGRMEAGERLSYNLMAVSEKAAGAQGPVEFNKGDLLGFDPEGRPVVLHSRRARLVSLTNLPDQDRLRLTLETADPLESGVKMDVLGKKGLMTFGLEQRGHRERVQLLNLIHEASGRGRPYTTAADVFVNQAYFSADLGEEALQALLESAQMVAEAGVSAEPVQAWLRDLSSEHFQTVSFDAAGRRLRLVEDAKAVGELDDAARAARIERIVKRTREFLAQMEPSVKSMNTRWAEAFRSMQESGGGMNLERFLRLYYQPGTATVWDSTRREMPKSVRLTYDVLSELHRSGEFEAVADLLSRAVPESGDAAQAYKFLETLSGLEWNPPEGASVVPLSTIGEVQKSFRPGSRAGTIFDPEFAATRNNYWIDLGEEVAVPLGGKTINTRYVPALGTAAYLGGGNRFGSGQMALSDYQNRLLQMVEKLKAGGPEAAPSAVSEYFSSVLPMLVGKEGVWRAPITAREAIVGAIQSRPSRSWFSAGDELVRNPFDVVVSESFLKQMPSDIAKRLAAGQEAYAVAFRHPVSATPFVRVRLGNPDDFLGERIIGIDESLRSLLQADSDRDFLNLMFLRSEEAIERARASIGVGSIQASAAGPPPATVMAEALAKAAGPSGEVADAASAASLAEAALPEAAKMSLQWKQVRAAQLLQGSAEDVSRMTSAFTKSRLSEDFYKDLQKVVEAAKASPGGLSPARMESMVSRLAGSTIGAYSNVLSTLYFSLENHPNLPIGGLDQTLLHSLLWNIRQVPIAAAKSKAGLGSVPMQLYWQMMSGLQAADPEAGARIFTDAVQKVSEAAGFETVIGSQRDLSDIASIFGLTEIGQGASRRKLRIGDRFNLFAEFARSEKGTQLLRDFVVHRNRDVDTMAALLTRGELSAEDAMRHLGKLRRTAPGAATYLRAGVAGEQFAASRSAAALGSVNKALSAAASEVTGRFRKALPVLAAAVGAAALAGLAGTKLRPAPADFRPATADVAPGEEYKGMGSSRPAAVGKETLSGPERVMAAPDGTDTLIEVETNVSKSRDWNSLKELFSGRGDARASSVVLQKSSGIASGKLRRREKLRDELRREIDY